MRLAARWRESCSDWDVRAWSRALAICFVLTVCVISLSRAQNREQRCKHSWCPKRSLYSSRRCNMCSSSSRRCNMCSRRLPRCNMCRRQLRSTSTFRSSNTNTLRRSNMWRLRSSNTWRSRSRRCSTCPPSLRCRWPHRCRSSLHHIRTARRPHLCSSPRCSRRCSTCPASRRCRWRRSCRSRSSLPRIRMARRPHLFSSPRCNSRCSTDRRPRLCSSSRCLRCHTAACRCPL
jgi:hypothetical protein